MKYSVVLLTQMISATLAGGTSRWSETPKAKISLTEMQQRTFRPPGSASIQSRMDYLSNRPTTQATEPQAAIRKRTMISPEGSRSAPSSPLRQQPRPAASTPNTLQRTSLPGSIASGNFQPRPGSGIPPVPTDDRLPLEFLRPRPRPSPHVNMQNGGAHTGIASTDSSLAPSRVTSPPPSSSKNYISKRGQSEQSFASAQQEVSAPQAASQERPRISASTKTTSRNPSRQSLSQLPSSASPSSKSSKVSSVHRMNRKRSSGSDDGRLVTRPRKAAVHMLGMDWNMYNRGRAFIATHAPESELNNLPDLDNAIDFRTSSETSSDPSESTSAVSSSGSIASRGRGQAPSSSLIVSKTSRERPHFE